MRKSGRNKANFVQESKVALLTEKIDQLEKRVAELERRFTVPSRNESSIDLSDPRYNVTSEGISEPVEDVACKAKRGRPSLLPLNRLLQRRDELVIFLEVRWPDLRDAMRRSKSIDHLLNALKKASPGARTNWPYIHLKENIGQLWGFLQDERCNGEPRQIAGAMAGVPKMACRSSLNTCSKHPSSLSIQPPAFLDHVERSNRALFKSRITVGPTEQNLKRLAKHCKDCRRFASNPTLMREAMEQSEPLR